MKALIFMLVSGFILCLPHAQGIAANSVCQKVCASGDQKCLDCCAENYGPVKQRFYSEVKYPCVDECNDETNTVNTSIYENPLDEQRNNLECLQECRDFMEEIFVANLKYECNQNVNYSDEDNESDEDRYRIPYDVCVRRCRYVSKLEINFDSCLERCERWLK